MSISETECGSGRSVVSRYALPYVARGRAAKSAAWLIVISGLLLVPTGCQTPNVPQTIQSINLEIDQLRKWEEQEIRDCNGDPQCEAEIRAIFRALRQDMYELSTLVQEENWEDARDARKTLRDRLIHLIPEFPDFKDMIEDLIRELDQKGGVLQLDAIAGSSTSLGGSPLVPLQHISYGLSGTLDVSDWLVTGPIAFTGQLEVTGLYATDLSGHTFFSGQVTAGTINVEGPSGEQIEASIYVDSIGGMESTLTATVGGSGELTLALQLDDGLLDANPAWGVLVASPTVVRLPIEMDQQHNLSLDYGPAQFGGLLPYVPWPASDYNDDGQLDETSDYAAFLVGWSAHEALADINVDENFDQDDIDLWWSQFQGDVAHE